MLNYNEYEALFNSGDDAALVARYFDDDVVMRGGARDYRDLAGKSPLERIHRFTFAINHEPVATRRTAFVVLNRAYSLTVQWRLTI